VEVLFHAFLTSALDGQEWSASRPGRFTPGERAPSSHWIRGWLGSKASLDVVEKKKIPSLPPPPGIEPPIAFTGNFFFMGKDWTKYKDETFLTILCDKTRTMDLYLQRVNIKANYVMRNHKEPIVQYRRSCISSTAKVAAWTDKILIWLEIKRTLLLQIRQIHLWETRIISLLIAIMKTASLVFSIIM
jgi:hypothetical protein